MVPIDGDCIPVVLPVVPGLLILGLVPGLSAADPVLPACANTRGAATKTTAMANTMVLLSLLVMDILLFLYYTLPSSPGLRLHGLTLSQQ
jgi:hypothetical protein